MWYNPVGWQGAQTMHLMNMKESIISVVAVTLISSTVFGGALNTKVVSGDASWVAHVDVDAMLNSELGKMFLAAVEQKDGFGKNLQAAKELLGCDPLKDIRGITLYGPRLGGREGVVVADATVAGDKLIAKLKETESYKSEKYREHTLHQWSDGKMRDNKAETRHGCFYDETTVVFATDVKRLQGALDVLDKKTANLAKSKAIESLPESAAGSFFILAADEIAFPKGKARRAEILQRISTISIQGGEADGGVFLNTSVLAGNDKDATNMRMFVKGFLALNEMMRQGEEFAALQDLGEKVAVGGEGKDVRVDASIPVKSVVRILTFIDEHRKAPKSRKRSERREDTKERD
jgi:hypothetical protein